MINASLKYNLRKITKYILVKLGLLQCLFDLYSWYKNIKPYSDFEDLYNHYYFSKYGYNSENDLALKKVHAKEIIRLLKPKKVLVAGCAEGNAVLAFRDLGIDTWGFDIGFNQSMISNSLATYLRKGSLISIPFSINDCFDTLVATDVFEHIYIKDIPIMVNEIYRLGINMMAIIIGWGFYPGHVTLKPIKWWEDRFYGKYKFRPDIKPLVYPGVYGLDPEIIPNKYFNYFIFWERIERV